MSLFQPDVL